MEPAYQAIIEKYPKLNHVQRINHLGTLGTGNHFIEVCQKKTRMSGSCCTRGSRGVGNRFDTFFIELAKNDMRQWMINLPDQDLAYLPQGTEHFDDYVRAVHWAQDYALATRGADDAQHDCGRTYAGRCTGVRGQCGGRELPSQLRD